MKPIRCMMLLWAVGAMGWPPVLVPLVGSQRARLQMAAGAPWGEISLDKSWTSGGPEKKGRPASA